MVSVLLIVECKEYDEGDDCSDLDQVSMVRLAVFDFEVFSCRFEEQK